MIVFPDIDMVAETVIESTVIELIVADAKLAAEYYEGNSTVTSAF